mgnify:CR=1 FL=1
MASSDRLARVRPVIDAQAELAWRNNIALELIRCDDPGGDPSLHQSAKKPLSNIRKSPDLEQNVDRVISAFDSPTEPVFLASGDDHQFTEVHLVCRRRLFVPNLGGNQRSNSSNPNADRLIAHNHATFGKRIPDISQAESTATLGPHSIANYVATKPMVSGRGARPAKSERDATRPKSMSPEPKS